MKRYIQTDHLNTPRWVTDDAGVRLWSWESDAFGTTAPNEDVTKQGHTLLKRTKQGHTLLKN